MTHGEKAKAYFEQGYNCAQAVTLAFAEEMGLDKDSAAKMAELANLLEGLDDFSIENQDKAVHEWIEAKGYGMGEIMNAFRLALVGEGKGPQMFDISGILGKEETLARLKRAIEVLG